MRIVLHVCCGVCAAAAAERLKREGHEIIGFFYNPNIHPRAEYARRLTAAMVVGRRLGFPVEAPVYHPDEWDEVAGDRGGEPEGGARCTICYQLRLIRTAQYLDELRWDAMATTLTVGPRKQAAVVNRTGTEIAGDRFLARDFKKQNGFGRAVALANEWNIYRQTYCGCRFSAGAR
jgi:predicted adenine nucleotide alpha hydrolase (AANH) superfamily ATPase